VQTKTGTFRLTNAGTPHALAVIPFSAQVAHREGGSLRTHAAAIVSTTTKLPMFIGRARAAEG
jgi:hypothetical protein